MKNFKLFAMPSCLAAALLLASTCYGQIPQLVGAGSSGLTNAMAVAAVNADSDNECGSAMRHEHLDQQVIRFELCAGSGWAFRRPE